MEQLLQTAPDSDDIIILPPSQALPVIEEPPRELILEDLLAGDADITEAQAIMPAFEDFYNQNMHTQPSPLLDPALMYEVGSFTDFSAELGTPPARYQDLPPEFGILKDKSPSKSPEKREVISVDDSSSPLPAARSPSPSVRPAKHVQIGGVSEIYIEREESPEYTPASPAYSVESVASSSKRSMSPSNLSVHSSHSPAGLHTALTEPDEVFSPAASAMHGDRPSYLEEETVIVGYDEDGILEVPETMLSEVNAEDEFVAERSEEGLPETDTMPASHTGHMVGPEVVVGTDEDGVLEVPDEMAVDTVNLLDGELLEQFEEALPDEDPLQPEPGNDEVALRQELQPTMASEGDADEEVVVEAAREVNVLEAGEWAPDAPIQFGGESLEASVREALHDPERSEQVQASLAKLADDSRVEGVAARLYDAADRAKEDQAWMQREVLGQEFASVGETPRKKRKQQRVSCNAVCFAR
jgi:hypothetical protein